MLARPGIVRWAFAAAVALVVTACGDPAVEGPVAQDTSDEAKVVGDKLPPELKDESTFAWSGAEALVVAGGVTTQTEFGLYEPAGASWRAVADPPFKEPLFSPAVAWTGKEFLVVGTRCSNADFSGSDAECDPGLAAAALYDAGSDAWTEIEPPPSDRKSAGQYLGSSSADRSAFLTAIGIQVLDHATRKWVSLERMDVGLTACLVGDQLLEVGGDAEQPRGRVYSFSEGRWSEEATLETNLQLWTFACGSSGVWVLPYNDGQLNDNSAALFTPAGTFEERPLPPSFPGAILADRTADRMAAFSLTGEIAVFDEKAQSWGAVDRRFELVNTLAVVDDSRLLVMGRLAGEEATTIALAEIP